MRRTGLVVALAALGALLPATAAEATTFQGTCDFAAEYGFEASGYSFSGTGINGGCNGSLNGALASGYEALYTSSGSGSFSCAGGFFQPGSGRIDFYRVVLDSNPQQRQFVDSLTLAGGYGFAAPLRTFVRRLAGAAGGDALERGTLSGQSCGDGTASIELATAETLRD